jgi:hypothetical protein
LRWKELRCACCLEGTTEEMDQCIVNAVLYRGVVPSWKRNFRCAKEDCLSLVSWFAKSAGNKKKNDR